MSLVQGLLVLKVDKYASALLIGEFREPTWHICSYAQLISSLIS